METQTSFKIFIEKTASFFDFAPDGLYILNRNGIICELNRRGAEMLGKESSELIESDFKQFITQNSLPIFKNFIRNVFESLNYQTVEIRLFINGKPTIFY